MVRTVQYWYKGLSTANGVPATLCDPEYISTIEIWRRNPHNLQQTKHDDGM